MIYDDFILNKLFLFSKTLRRVEDTSVLYEHILNVSKKFMNADATSIYLNETNGLELAFFKGVVDEHNDFINNKIFTTAVIEINSSHILGYAVENCKTVFEPDVDNINNDVPYKFKTFIEDHEQEKLGKITNTLVVPIISSTTNKVLSVIEFLNIRDEKNNLITNPDPNSLLIVRIGMLIAETSITRTSITYNNVMRMIKLVQMRDPMETGSHINRVADFSVELFEQYVKKYKVDRNILIDNKDIFHLGSMLHDIGKVGISDSILKKNGKLDASEFSIIKTHPGIGATLFSEKFDSFDKLTYEIILYHHENWDGSGYYGLKGSDDYFGFLNINNSSIESKEFIPLSAQLVALADVFDALSTNRSYKVAWSIESVVKEINFLSGKKFNPKLVEIFNQSLPRFIKIMEFYKN